ncbi:MAG TPA: hypothetical protein VGO08_17905 [Burkholderiales bacterium]|jgi:hypothetical protein|nr:hypothetical protein [Burkholderiales bacterium]
MRTVFTDYDVWSFKKDDRNRWMWRRESPDAELLIEARSSFDALNDCIEDAGRFGYTGAFTIPA